MRVLFVDPAIPWPLRSGQFQRSYALIRALAERHEVVLSAPQVKDTEERLAGLADVIRGFVPGPEGASRPEARPAGPRWSSGFNLFRDYATNRMPFRFRMPPGNWRSEVDAIVDDFDAVVCRYAYTLPVIPMRAWPRVVLDADDLNYRLLLQHAMNGGGGLVRVRKGLEMIRTYRCEQQMFRRVAHTLVCSEGDLERIRCRRKSIVRNGIDPPPAERLHAWPDEKTVVLVATFRYPPNATGLRWFLAEVWPAVRQRVTGARLLVVGRGANLQLLPFATAEGVELVGEVERTDQWFSRGVLSIAPLWQGGGTRIKILESLACGRPVVSTTIGADGLERLGDDQGVFREDDPAKMAQRIVELLDCPGNALDVGRAGRRVIEEEFSWRHCCRDLARGVEEWICEAAALQGARRW